LSVLPLVKFAEPVALPTTHEAVATDTTSSANETTDPTAVTKMRTLRRVLLAVSNVVIVSQLMDSVSVGFFKSLSVEENYTVAYFTFIVTGYFMKNNYTIVYIHRSGSSFDEFLKGI
jgi:hypothetical protein